MQRPASNGRLTEKVERRGCGDTGLIRQMTMKKILIQSLLVALSLVASKSSLAADVIVAAPKATEVTVNVVDERKLSPLSAKVIRLVQAGVDEKVVLAYVQNNAPKTSPSAEELLYLHELNVPSAVLASLLAPSKKEEMTAAIPVATEKVEVTSNYASVPGVQQSPPQVNGSTVISTPVVVTQPAPPTVVYTQPAPVYVEAPPVYYETRPTISFGFGFGHFGHGYHHGYRGHYGHGRHH